MYNDVLTKKFTTMCVFYTLSSFVLLLYILLLYMNMLWTPRCIAITFSLSNQFFFKAMKKQEKGLLYLYIYL